MNMRQLGMSFIEITVVILIIGLFLGLVAPKAFEWLGRGKETTTKLALKSTNEAIIQFQADTSHLPTTLEDLVTKPSDPKIKDWHGPYLNKFPKDGWKNELVYQINAAGSPHPFELYSLGKNGENASTEDYIHARDL